MSVSIFGISSVSIFGISISFSFKISAIDVKYVLSFWATASDSVNCSSSIISSSGNRLFDAFESPFTVRKCAHIIMFSIFGIIDRFGKIFALSSPN